MILIFWIAVRLKRTTSAPLPELRADPDGITLSSLGLGELAPLPEIPHVL